MLSLELLRIIADEREREIRSELRRRWLVAPRPDATVRWHHRPTRRAPEAR
jgi:hypothetical protein